MIKTMRGKVRGKTIELDEDPHQETECCHATGLPGGC